MKRVLLSTNYWMTLGAIALIQVFSPRLEGNSYLLISIVCASYFLGRGIAQFSKSAVGFGYKSPEFTVLLIGLCLNGYDIYLGGTAGLVGMVIATVFYNVGRGLALSFRSRVSTVLNR